MGRNGGHQRGDSTAAYGEVLMATVRNSCRSDADLTDGPCDWHGVVEG